MSLNNFGTPVFLAEGANTVWTISFTGDPGSQFFTADIKIPNQGAVHWADQQKKRKDNNGNATYSVVITNQGPGGCFHNLQGGGLV